MKIELALVVMLSPLSFSFLGLNALKDQGIAPFKSIISLMYRIVILSVIISGINTITNKVGISLTSIYDNASWWTKVTGSGNGVWPALLGITTSYLIFGYLAFKSDSIAANLASGSTNLGAADVASAAAMGAAAGAAIATGGASLAAGTAKAGPPMSEFLKDLAASGGSISNASSSGAGPAPIGPRPTRPSMSMGAGGQAAGNRAPRRSDFPSAVKNTESSSPAGPTPAAASKTSASSGGSGANAAINAPVSQLEQQVGDLVKALNQPKEGKGVSDHLSELNQHIAQERAATHVSINTHHSD